MLIKIKNLLEKFSKNKLNKIWLIFINLLKYLGIRGEMVSHEPQKSKLDLSQIQKQIFIFKNF